MLMLTTSIPSPITGKIRRYSLGMGYSLLFKRFPFVSLGLHSSPACSSFFGMDLPCTNMMIILHSVTAKRTYQLTI